MKKIIAAIILSAFVFACSSSEESADINQQKDDDGQYQVELFLSTRGSVDDSMVVGDTIEAEEWEKEIKEGVMIYLYYPADEEMIIRKYSSFDLQSQPLELKISSYPSDGICECYVVANYELAGITSLSSNKDLQKRLTDISDYNGGYANVSEKCLRTGGFVMSAMTTQKLTPMHKSISLSLDRVVAKVIFDVEIAPLFKIDNQGELKLGNVGISNSAISTSLFGTDTLYELDYKNILSQPIYQIKKNEKYTSMLYIFESPEVENIKEDGVLLSLDGQYTPPGSNPKTEDVKYFVRIKGDGDKGKITRNKIYYVKGTIKTLGSADLDVEVHVLDWENEIDQTSSFEQIGGE